MTSLISTGSVISGGRLFRRFGSSDSKCFAQIQLTIDKAYIPKKVAVITAVTIAAAMLLTSCGNDGKIETSDVEVTTSVVETEPPETEESQEPQNPWTDEEVEAMVLTLAGECYDDKPRDKRLVCEVILNRVSTAGFDNNIIDVVTAPNQFDGYWTQSRDVTENDYEVAIQALEDWYANDCEALSEYLFFEAGDNRENEFRKEF